MRRTYLEFVLARLGLRGWVEEVDGENLGWETTTVSGLVCCAEVGVAYHLDSFDGLNLSYSFEQAKSRQMVRLGEGTRRMVVDDGDARSRVRQTLTSLTSTLANGGCCPFA